MLGISLVIGALFAFTLASPVQRYNITTRNFEIYCVGNCNRDVTTTTTPGVVLMGGGEDVDDAFIWMINNSGGGDFVILRTSGSDGYNDYIYGLGRVNSVTTIVTTSKDASYDSEVLRIVAGAEALFFAGGDQSTYFNYWAGTPLNDEIESLIHDKKVSIGGTSAGLHIQGEFVYTGAVGSAVSDECLENPYNVFVTLREDFLTVPFMGDIVTDSHFYERDRMGRTITFLARLIQDGLSSAGVKGISVDEATALLVDRLGTAKIVGSKSAYFLKATQKPLVCSRGNPLTMVSVAVYRLDNKATNKGSFSLATWNGTGGADYYIDVTAGKMRSTQSGGSVY